MAEPNIVEEAIEIHGEIAEDALCDIIDTFLP